MVSGLPAYGSYIFKAIKANPISRFSTFISPFIFKLKLNLI